MKYIKYLLIGLLLLGGCSTKDDGKLTKFDETTLNSGFDTFITLIGYTKEKDEFDDYFDTVKTSFSHYNQLFDKYNDYEGINNIKTINDQAGKEPVKVDQEIINLLQLSKDYYDLTNGQFDVTLGPVLNIWHEVREASMASNEQGNDGTLPDMNKLQEAKTCDGFDNLEIDEKASTVYLNKTCASLDVGSIAKGYAAEKVAIQLEKDGLKHAILNAGGNVRIIGDKPETKDWSVGIQVPNMETANTDSLASVKLSNSGSFVTSGDYQRFYLYQGEMMHHIIDPSTLMPARHARAVTIVTENSGIADALSTSLFTLSYEDGKALIDKLNKQGTKVDAIWVYDQKIKAPQGVKTYPSGNYQLVFTDGIKDRIVVN